MITVLHRGGYAQMIAILHGGGSLWTPKSDYVICARPLMVIVQLHTLDTRRLRIAAILCSLRMLGEEMWDVLSTTVS